MSKNATCGRNEETKKGQKLSCVKLAICPDHPRRRRPLKFCVLGRVREVVIYFKFHENRSCGLLAVEGRKSPSPIALAHGLYNSLYYRTSRDQQCLQRLAGFNFLCRFIPTFAVQAAPPQPQRTAKYAAIKTLTFRETTAAFRRQKYS